MTGPQTGQTSSFYSGPFRWPMKSCVRAAVVPLPPERGGHGRAAGPREPGDAGRPGAGPGSLRQGRICRGAGAVLGVHWPVRESREVTIARRGPRGVVLARTLSSEPGRRR